VVFSSSAADTLEDECFSSILGVSYSNIKFMLRSGLRYSYELLVYILRRNVEVIADARVKLVSFFAKKNFCFFIFVIVFHANNFYPNATEVN
jgi:hypothetical protein